METKQTDYTEGRKGFSEAVRNQLPKNYANKAFATHAEAVAVFSNTSIAFRVYEYTGTEMTKPFRVSELGAYVALKRAKKSGPWIKTRELLASCAYDAQNDAKEEKIVSLDEWISIQTKQHLKSLGIK